MPEARDAGAHRVEAGPERRHRGLGPGRLGLDSVEAHSVLGQFIQDGGRGPGVAVAPHAIGPKRVDQDEHHVHVVALAELRDRLGLIEGARGKVDLQLREQRDDREKAGQTEVEPRGVDDTSQQADLRSAPRLGSAA